MQKAFSLLIFFSLLAGSSCIKFGDADANVLYYHVSNQSDYRIKVVFHGFLYQQYHPDSNDDSVVYFKPGEDRDLLVVYGINSRGPEPENSDTLKGIHFLEVYKSDTIPATEDFRLRKNWVYDKPHPYKLQYSTAVTNASFIP